jgi:prepilin-type N-terminal cleavage/methylation domain-containing protein
MRSSAVDLRLRAGKEAGFTLVELLVVMVILGVLASIAIASYTGLRDRSGRSAVESNVRSVIPALEAFHTDRDSYAGATLTVLRTQYDLEIDDSAASNYKISGQTDTSYCVQNHAGDWYAWKAGPAESIGVGSASHC